MPPQSESHSAILATINIHHTNVTGTFELRDFDTNPYLVLNEKESDHKRVESRIYLDKKKIKDLAYLGANLAYRETLSVSDIKEEPAE